MTNKTKEELRNLARELADCADVMPTSLKKHQDRVYNACLDMIYKFDNIINEKIVQIELKKIERQGAYNTADIKLGEMKGLDLAIAILKE